MYSYKRVVALNIKRIIIHKSLICLIVAFCFNLYGREGCGELGWDGENGRVNITIFEHKHSEFNTFG
jgi:hypothetical protein